MRRLIKKNKKQIIFAIIILSVICIYIYTMKLGLSINISANKKLSESNERVIFINEYEAKYIHIKINSSKQTGYKIISPKGEIVVDEELDIDNEFKGEGIKGEWKIIFNQKENVEVSCKIWIGNLEKNDNI